MNYRKESKALQFGSLVHFMPRDNVYVYKRAFEGEEVLVILSNNNEEVELALDRFAEVLGDHQKGVNALTSEQVSLENTLKVAPESSLIIELSKD